VPFFISFLALSCMCYCIACIAIKVLVTVVLLDILTERLTRKVRCQVVTVFKGTVSQGVLLQVFS